MLVASVREVHKLAVSLSGMPLANQLGNCLLINKGAVFNGGKPNKLRLVGGAS